MSTETEATDLNQRRLAIVREHMESENVHDFDTTLATFEHPRYELIATGQVFDGPDEVRQYYATSRAAFPDQRNEIISLRHADDAVVVEFDLLGTHGGPFMGIPATGKTFRCRMVALFEFRDDRIVCERVYFDQLTVLEQLGVARSPTSLTGRLETLIGHPWTIGRGLVRRFTGR